MEDRGKGSERWGVGCGDKGGDTKIENEKGKENNNKKKEKKEKKSRGWD